jgi:transposase-like protein
MGISQIFALTPDQAYFALEDARWGDNPQCPYCHSTSKVWPHPDGKRRAPRLQCGACSATFCVTVGTMFHRSHIPLRTWLLAIAYMASDPRICASELGALIGINRRATVSQMLSTIRSSYMTKPEDRELMTSIFELFDIDPMRIEEAFSHAV